jgi:hypothetical protein
MSQSCNRELPSLAELDEVVLPMPAPSFLLTAEGVIPVGVPRSEMTEAQLRAAGALRRQFDRTTRSTT